MGSRPPPKEPEFGGDCYRFAPTKTPRIFLASFANIEFCHDIWPPDLPKPPMSMELVQTGYNNCSWAWSWGRWDILLSFNVPNASVLTFVFDDQVYIFEGIKAGLSFGFSNSADHCSPPWYYGFGGYGHVIARAETTAPSLSKLCVLAGIPDDIDTKCDIMPIDEETADIRFFRPDLQIKHHMRYIIDETY